MKSKSTSKKADNAVLATCPVNGAGWCPYPFSVAQLKRRLKAKELEAKLKLEAKSELEATSKLEAKSKAKVGTKSAKEKPVTTQSKPKSRSKSA